MSDRRLRDLERRAQQGDVDAEAELLRQRVRLGELGRGWLELLALIGYPPGCLALGERPRVFLPDLRTVSEWEGWLAEHHKPRYKKAIQSLASADGQLQLVESIRRGWGPAAYLRVGYGLVDACLPLDHAWRTTLRELEGLEPEAMQASGREWLRALTFSPGSVDERLRHTVSSAFGSYSFAESLLTSARRTLSGGDPLSSSPLVGLRVRAGIVRGLAPWASQQAQDPEGLDLERLAFRRRVRIHGLTKVQLEVAAFLGHEQAAHEVHVDKRNGDGMDLMTWSETLGRWSRTLGARVAVAAASLALPKWEEAMDDPRPRRCLEAAAAWISKPGKKAGVAVSELISRGPLPEADDLPRWAGEACLLAGAACLEKHKSTGRTPTASMAVVRAADATSEHAVREAVRDELLSWAVGALADDFEED